MTQPSSYTRLHSLAWRLVCAFWIACVAYSVFGRLAYPATVVGVAPWQWMHGRCAMRYDADKAWRTTPGDCLFVSTFEH